MTIDTYVAERELGSLSVQWGIEFNPSFVGFPVCNVNGSRMGTIYRRFTNGAKYRVLPANLRRLGGLFGLKEALIARTKTVVVVESATDVIAISRCSNLPSVGLLAPEITAEQAAVIASRWQNVAILLDGDSFGRHGARQVKNAMMKHGKLTIMLSLPEGHDPDSLYRHDKQSLMQILSSIPCAT